MCGLIGIGGRYPVAHSLHEGLNVLQHRGQDAAGLATYDADGKFHEQRGNGLVRDVFRGKKLARLRGNIGIGHLRYPTAGTEKSEEAQPLYVNSPYGIALGHNGNLINAQELRQELFRSDRRHINTKSDSEILLNVFAHELLDQPDTPPDPQSLFDAVRGVNRRCIGAYAAVCLIAGWGLLAFRDPYGIRPVVFGSRNTDQGREHIVASESVALDMLGFSLERDLRPGEALFVSLDGEVHSQLCGPSDRFAPCVFEYVYFARPDSVMNGVSVQRSRMRMGKRLANKILREWPDHDIDVVIPVPDTSRTAALEMAYQLDRPYREGFIKNRYIGRTFIMPEAHIRRQSVRRKLNPIRNEYENTNVLLVDDSIVRGTTSREIVQMARDAGARKVYFCSASPPIRHPNIYGIDMPNADELIAHDRSVDEICAAIGADRLIYQDLPDLIAAIQEGNPELRHFDCSVFTGEYATGVPDGYLDRLAHQRGAPAGPEPVKTA